MEFSLVRYVHQDNLHVLWPSAFRDHRIIFELSIRSIRFFPALNTDQVIEQSTGNKGRQCSESCAYVQWRVPHTLQGCCCWKIKASKDIYWHHEHKEPSWQIIHWLHHWWPNCQWWYNALLVGAAEQNAFPCGGLTCFHLKPTKKAKSMAADMKVATKHARQTTIGTEFMYAYVLAIMAMSKESLSIKALYS